MNIILHLYDVYDYVRLFLTAFAVRQSCYRVVDLHST